MTVARWSTQRTTAVLVAAIATASVVGYGVLTARAPAAHATTARAASAYDPFSTITQSQLALMGQTVTFSVAAPSQPAVSAAQADLIAAKADGSGAAIRETVLATCHTLRDASTHPCWGVAFDPAGQVMPSLSAQGVVMVPVAYNIEVVDATTGQSLLSASVGEPVTSSPASHQRGVARATSG
jgi:hypothetical protein